MLTNKALYNRTTARSLLNIAIETFYQRRNPGCGPGHADMDPIKAIAEITDIPQGTILRAVLEQATRQRASDLYDFMRFHRHTMLASYADALPGIGEIDQRPTPYFNAVTNYLSSAEPCWDGSQFADKLELALEEM